MLNYLSNTNSKTNAIYLITFVLMMTGLISRISNVEWLIVAELSDYREWYPSFYWAVFLGFKFIYYLKYILLFTQILLIFIFSEIKKRELITVLMLTLSTFYFYKDHVWIPSFTLVLSYFFYKHFESMHIPKNNVLNTKERWWLFTLILVGFIVRITWMLSTENTGTVDSGLRLLYSKEWIDTICNQDSLLRMFNPYFLMPSLDWLPLHQYIIGTISWALNDWAFTPRVVTVLFGSLTIIPLVKLCMLKFDRETTVIASLIILFYGYHIFLSSQVTTEVIYVFLILYAYYFIEKWLIIRNNRFLYFAGIFICLISLLRYEGWVFSFLLVLFVFISSKFKLKTTLIFTSILLIPISFVSINMIFYGLHPLHGILYSDYQNLYLSNVSYDLDSLIKEYLGSYIPLLLFSIFIFIISYFKTSNYKQLRLLMIYTLPLLPFIYKSLDGTLLAQARYLVIYTVPLIPYVSNVISVSLKPLASYLKIFSIVFFLGYMNLSFYNNMDRVTMSYAKGFFESSKYVEKITTGNYFIDNSNNIGWENWIVNSDIYYADYRANMVELKGEMKVIYEDIKNNQKRAPVKKLVYMTDKSEITADIIHLDLIKLIHEDAITHFVLFPNGMLNKKLKLGKKIERIDNVYFEKIYDRDGFLIYSKTFVPQQ